jgi:hypothetical protein
VDLNFDRALLRNSSSRIYKSSGVIDSNYFAYAPAQLEREAPDAAAEVERASAFLEWKRHAFAVDTLMKSQKEFRKVSVVK